MEPPRRPRPKGEGSRSDEETEDGTGAGRFPSPEMPRAPEPRDKGSRPSAPPPRRDTERRRVEGDSRREGAPRGDTERRRGSDVVGGGSLHERLARALPDEETADADADPNAETHSLPLKSLRARETADPADRQEPKPTTGRTPRSLAETSSDAGRVDGTPLRAQPAVRPRISARGISAGGEEQDLRNELARRVKVHPRSGAPPEDGVHLRRLLEINKALTRELDLGRLLDMIMDAAIALSDAKRGFLVTWDKGEARVVRARNIGKEAIASPDAAISRHLLREAIDRRETLVIAEAAIERTGYASVQGMDLKSVLVAPLLSRGRIVGAIYLDDPDRVGIFSAEDVVTTVEAFCDQAAIALSNAYTLAESKNRFESQRFKLKRIEAEVRKNDEESVRRFGNIVGNSAAMKKVFDLLERVVDTNFPVVITGESGVGKELVAKAIHFSGVRRDGPFVASSCAAVPETLLDSELFGYTAGSFTGATSDRKGLFEQAHGGTLFLDEIEEMSPGMQGKLLRVLQEGEIRRVGAKETITVNVRCLCATNRDLRTMVERGEFRRDLYYRLNVIPVVVPPLRERREDIPLIVNELVTKLSSGGPPLEVAPEAIQAMQKYSWPGNVRELENELKRIAAVGNVRRIGLGDLASRIVNPSPPPGAPGSHGTHRHGTHGHGAHGEGPQNFRAEASASSELPTLNLRQMERLAIERALQDAGGNKTQAAKILGLSRRGLLKKLERYKLEGLAAEADAADAADADASDEEDDDE